MLFPQIRTHSAIQSASKQDPQMLSKKVASANCYKRYAISGYIYPDLLIIIFPYSATHVLYKYR